ncbi:MAG TPA: hypothetical protein VN112_04405 [Ensifer sp.]|nr:hypothetical protein [Ensifer sp.]
MKDRFDIKVKLIGDRVDEKIGILRHRNFARSRHSPRPSKKRKAFKLIGDQKDRIDTPLRGQRVSFIDLSLNGTKIGTGIVRKSNVHGTRIPPQRHRDCGRPYFRLSFSPAGSQPSDAPTRHAQVQALRLHLMQYPQGLGALSARS